MLPIQTTQESGIPIPLGLVMSQRTSKDEILVVDEKNDAIYLQPRLDVVNSTTPESILETSMVREVLMNGHTDTR